VTGHIASPSDMPGFFKSSHSGASGCVEIGFLPGQEAVLIRDSKISDGPVLRFTRVEWTAFLAGVRDGEFEMPS
jgi:hypothetical protein